MEEKVILILETYTKMVDKKLYLENQIVNLQEKIDKLTTKCGNLNNENHDLKQFAIEKEFSSYKNYFDDEYFRYSLEDLLNENKYPLREYLKDINKFDINLADIKEHIKKMYQEDKE